MIDERSFHQPLPREQISNAVRAQKKKRGRDRRDYADQRTESTRSFWRIAHAERGGYRQRQTRFLLVFVSGWIRHLAFAVRRSRGLVPQAPLRRKPDRTLHIFRPPTPPDPPTSTLPSTTQIPFPPPSPSL